MTTENAPRDFGHYLRSCRQAKGISLEEVSRVTRITISVLKDIEGEESARLPDPVFVRSFLRAYAEAVGADETEALARYRAHAKAVLLSNQRLRPRQMISGRSIVLRLLFGLVLFGLVVGATLFYAQRQSSEGTGREPTEAVSETATSKAPQATVPERDRESVVPSENPEETAAETVAEKKQDAESAGYVLEVTATEATRLKIIADGGIPREFHLKSAERITLEAERSFNLLIDNAGGIRLVLDGMPVVVPGKSGQVVTLQLP